VAFNLVMVLWHVPVFFDAAENNQLIHIWLMHASFFVTGILFWLTIIPSHPFRITASPLWQMGAIIGTNVTMFIIAMTLSIFHGDKLVQRLRARAGRDVVTFCRPADRCRILWICGDFWAVPALGYVIRKGMASEGGFSAAVDRMLHRDLVVLQELRTAKPLAPRVGTQLIAPVFARFVWGRRTRSRRFEGD